MLKIYLDWNCITHSKKDDSLSFIEQISENYQGRVIFPYSTYHIRDVLVSRKAYPNEFSLDLEQLTKICGKHYLQFENNRIYPKFTFPKEVVERQGDTLEFAQTFEWLSPQNYYSLKKNLQDSIPSEILTKIRNSTSNEAFQIIENYTWDILHSDLDSILNKNNVISRINTFEQQFKNLCIALDLFGYKSEDKNKQFTNIDADAGHVFMAANCDLFVSNDKKLREKARACYAKYNCSTIVISPKELPKLLEEKISLEYNFNYIRECIDKYGKGRVEEDGIHYKILPAPAWGLFNLCISNESIGYTKENGAFFLYSFQRCSYLFYTELEFFFGRLLAFTPNNIKKNIEEQYCKPIMSGERGVACKIHIIDEHMDIILSTDPNSDVVVPLMQVIVNDI